MTAPLKVHDMTLQGPGGTVVIPPHVEYLMQLKGSSGAADNDFVSIHEWSARLFHAILVEAGYFPVFDGPLSDITPNEALVMPDSVRIPM
jgi:hypothetical protein